MRVAAEAVEEPRGAEAVNCKKCRHYIKQIGEHLDGSPFWRHEDWRLAITCQCRCEP